MEEESFIKFLKDAGFPNLVSNFQQQDIVTLEAAKDLTVEDMINEVGCKPTAAKTIFNRLQALKSGTSTSGPIPELPQNNQLIPFQHQMQMMQLQMNLESAQKFAEMEMKLKIQEMESKHKQELIDEKHKSDIESVKKDIEHLKLIQKLEQEKTTAIYEGKLAVMEEKNKQKPESGIPPWWSATYGIWDPLLFDRYPSASSLLTPIFFRTIQGWLGGPRVWDLRYRGSRDGFNSTDFHRCCDNIGATVTIIRSNGYLFGGYTPLSWNTSSGYQNNSSCFLFTLTNAYGKPPTHFYSNGSNSIYCHSSYGPTFGGHDLYISPNCHSNSSFSSFPHSYNDSLGHGNSTFAGAHNFTVSEIEVFRVF